ISTRSLASLADHDRYEEEAGEEGRGKQLYVVRNAHPLRRSDGQHACWSATEPARVGSKRGTHKLHGQEILTRSLPCPELAQGQAAPFVPWRDVPSKSYRLISR